MTAHSDDIVIMRRNLRAVIGIYEDVRERQERKTGGKQRKPQRRYDKMTNKYQQNIRENDFVDVFKDFM